MSTSMSFIFIVVDAESSLRHFHLVFRMVSRYTLGRERKINFGRHLACKSPFWSNRQIIEAGGLLLVARNASISNQKLCSSILRSILNFEKPERGA